MGEIDVAIVKNCPDIHYMGKPSYKWMGKRRKEVVDLWKRRVPMLQYYEVVSVRLWIDGVQQGAQSEQ